VPVYEGYVLYHAVQRLNLAGDALTNNLMKLLQKKKKLDKDMDKEVVKNIKEKICYVALDYEDEMQKSETSTEVECSYELPDGEVITVGSERFCCTERLFQPKLALTSNNEEEDEKVEQVETEQEGVHRMLYSSIMKSDVDIRKDLYGNVVLSGGNTMFQGFGERVQQQLKYLAPDSMKVQVIADEKREHLAWIGGSVLCSLSTFEENFITREEYEETGPSIVYRKCT